MRDKIDMILDSLPEEELSNIYSTIFYIQQNYLFQKSLTEKGVIIDYADESEKIITLWDKTFAHNISIKIKDHINYKQFKWHIFSYKKQECLEKEVARQAFDAISKDECYVMYQESPHILLYKNAKAIKATDFDSQQDIYIFDTNFTWTYVHTHESTCGPYFYSLI